MQFDLAEILKTQDAIDVVESKRSTELDPEIPYRDKFQFDSLRNGPIIPATFGEPPCCFALDFALSGFANVRPDHEAKQVLGIYPLSMPTYRQQC